MTFVLRCLVMMALLIFSRAIAFAADIVPDTALARAAASPAWLALLHYQNGESQITDKAFFLAADGQTNPLDELRQTVAAFEEGAAQCRFPARKAFIAKELPEVAARFRKVRCVALDEYLAKVPAETVSLAFATEYIPNPTTMMGHLFLKIEGASGSTHPTHALSFFADLTKVRSTAEFIAGSLFMGTDGVYILEPYRDRRDAYLKKGQRSIWDYELKLDEAERRTLVLHIWEMKGINVSYDLKDNNCGSAILRLLMVANPEMEEAQYKSFITPADLLRALDDRGYIGAAHFSPSDLHMLRMQGRPGAASPTANVLGKDHATTFKAAYVAGRSDDFLKFSVAPAYNDLMSRNDYAAQEYEVNLFKAEFGVSRKLDKANIQTLDIISFKSFLPVTAHDKSLSRSFRAGWENEGFGMETGKLFPTVDGGVGFTVTPVGDDLFAYSLLNAGYSYYKSQNVFSVAPEAGVILREGDIGKGVLSYSHSFNSDDYKYRDKVTARQSFFVGKDLNLNVDYSHVRPDNGRAYDSASVGISVFY